MTDFFSPSERRFSFARSKFERRVGTCTRDDDHVPSARRSSPLVRARSELNIQRSGCKFQRLNDSKTSNIPKKFKHIKNIQKHAKFSFGKINPCQIGSNRIESNQIKSNPLVAVTHFSNFYHL